MALDNATRGMLDECRIRISGRVSLGSNTAFRARNCVFLNIERAPGTERQDAIINWQATCRPRLGIGTLTAPLTEGAITFFDISINRSGSFTLLGEIGCQLQLQLWNCSPINSAAASIKSQAHTSIVGSSISGISFSLSFVTGQENRILRGLSVDANGYIEAGLLIGCDIQRPTGTAYADPARGIIIYNNHLINPSASNGAGRSNGAVSVKIMARMPLFKIWSRRHTSPRPLWTGTLPMTQL